MGYGKTEGVEPLGFSLFSIVKTPPSVQKMPQIPIIFTENLP